jgi:hypothetical protein
MGNSSLAGIFLASAITALIPAVSGTLECECRLRAPMATYSFQGVVCIKSRLGVRPVMSPSELMRHYL